jgi:hypothetical protein
MNLIKTPIRLDLRFWRWHITVRITPYPNGIGTLPQEAWEKCPDNRPKNSVFQF